MSHDSVKILVVDDDAAVATVITEVMNAWGDHYVVKSVSSGEAALECIADVPPDVVLLDVVMPGMDGIETFRRIRLMNPDLPVIMMTGLGSDFLNAAEKASPLACIAKPINFHYLRQIIELTAACHPGSR